MQNANNNNNDMMKIIIVAVIALVVGVGGGYALGSKNKTSTDNTNNASMTAMSPSSDGVTVGGAKMVASKNIVENALSAKNVTSLVSLVQKASLVSTLESAGPFTVFAPTNDAIAKLPSATVTSLEKPENVATLTKVLTYHVVSGTYTTAALKVMAEKGQTLTSVQGELLKPVMVDNQLEIQDTLGNNVTIQTPDVISSNGVTHVINSVLMPN